MVNCGIGRRDSPAAIHDKLKKPTRLPIFEVSDECCGRAAKGFVRTERAYAPNPKNRAACDELFMQYRKLCRALPGIYRGANGRRFAIAEVQV